MQRSPAIRVLHLHLRPVLQQQFHHRHVAVSGRYMELEEVQTDTFSVHVVENAIFQSRVLLLIQTRTKQIKFCLTSVAPLSS